jgi:uncharacterized membrane protein YbhN (UPF0104 family)
MKKLFNLLIIISFLFICIYLWKQDLIIPVLPYKQWIAPSLLLLFAGFYVSTISWSTALRVHGRSISHRDAVVSHGQAVFAKYIPGKVWVILGRASYISGNKSDLKNNSFVSLKEQLVYTWVGFVISAIPTLIFYGIQWITILLVLIILLLSLFLFVPTVHYLTVRVLKKITGRDIELPVINFRKSLPVILSTSLIWAAWTLSFYFFMRIFSSDIDGVMAFAFPLSVCFGLIAIILPGGLGLREGIIIGYLTLAGMDIETATTISFLNRFAFIAGEVFIFLLALIFRLTGKRKTGGR